MLLKATLLGIHTGGPLISVLNVKDAEEMDIHYGDRILLNHDGRKAVAVADIGRMVKPGRIGLMNELALKLGVNAARGVRVSLLPKGEGAGLIKKKMTGQPLSEAELQTIISEIVHNQITESELAAFVTACYIHELSNAEVVSLCKAMVLTGDHLHFSTTPVMDVHCIGGVPGNRTTMVIVPIIAAAGLLIPKTSSRAITSPAGTADTLETLADVSLDISRLKRVVIKTKGAMVWGGALNLAPADDKIIRVEHPLNIDAEGQMIASVMAKKFAVGSTHLLLDIPVGGLAKVKDAAHGTKLRKRFEYVAKKLGIKIKVIFTDGKEPIGNGIGPALEAHDVLKVMRCAKDAPLDLREKSLMMAGMMLEMAGKAKVGQGYERARDLLDSGEANRKFIQILKAQGPAPKSRLRLGTHTRLFFAKRSGTVKAIESAILSRTAKLAGAPRDYGAGVYIHHHLGDEVKKGDALFTVYAHNPAKLAQACGNVKKDVFLIR